MKLSTILLLAMTVAAFGQQDPDEAGKKQIIADVRAKALEYLKTVPNFSCVEVMRHNVDPSGTSTKWKLLGTTHEQISFIGLKEEYQVVSVGGKKPGNPDNRPAGMMSIDDFNGVLSQIFDPKVKAEIAWSKWESLRGHRVHELGYKVLRDNSTMTIGKKDQTVGQLGFIYADADSGEVLRVANAATEIPTKYPLQGISFDYHWEYVKLGDHVVLLPLKVDFHEKDGKSLIWNEIEFRDYKPEAIKKSAR